MITNVYEDFISLLRFNTETLVKFIQIYYGTYIKKGKLIKRQTRKTIQGILFRNEQKYKCETFSCFLH